MKSKDLLKWGLAAVVILAVGGGGYYYQSGDIPEKLYEREKARLANLAPEPVGPREDMAFTNVNIVPMTGEFVLTGQTIIVRNGRVAALDPDGTLAFDDGLRVIDGAGAYLMPGLADMHMHTSGNPLAYNLLLANGITTIRETAGMPKYLDLAKRVESGEILAPTIYTTGPILGSRSGSETSIAPGTPEEMRAEVARQYDAGYRMIKPYTFLSDEAYSAVMEEAKNRGMYAVGHVPYSVGLDGAIAAGQNELAHIHSLHQEFFKDFSPENVFDLYEIKEDDLRQIVAKVANSGLSVCVTLIVNQALADSQDLDSFLGRPMQAYEIPWAEPYMRSAKWYFNKMWPRKYLEEIYLPALYFLTRELQEAGVTLVLGTDSGVTGLVAGFSAQEELHLLVKAGLSPYQALLTGTRNAALVTGDAHEWGTIDVGKRADMIMLGGNPLENIENTRKIVGVMKAGRWLDRWRLDKMLDDVLEAY